MDKRRLSYLKNEKLIEKLKNHNATITFEDGSILKYNNDDLIELSVIFDNIDSIDNLTPPWEK